MTPPPLNETSERDFVGPDSGAPKWVGTAACLGVGCGTEGLGPLWPSPRGPPKRWDNGPTQSGRGPDHVRPPKGHCPLGGSDM